MLVGGYPPDSTRTVTRLQWMMTICSMDLENLEELLNCIGASTMEEMHMPSPQSTDETTLVKVRAVLTREDWTESEIDAIFLQLPISSCMWDSIRTKAHDELGLSDFVMIDMDSDEAESPMPGVEDLPMASPPLEEPEQPASPAASAPSSPVSLSGGDGKEIPEWLLTEPPNREVSTNNNVLMSGLGLSRAEYKRVPVRVRPRLWKALFGTAPPPLEYISRAVRGNDGKYQSVQAANLPAGRFIFVQEDPP